MRAATWAEFCQCCGRSFWQMESPCGVSGDMATSTSTHGHKQNSSPSASQRPNCRRQLFTSSGNQCAWLMDTVSGFCALLPPLVHFFYLAALSPNMARQVETCPRACCTVCKHVFLDMLRGSIRITSCHGSRGDCDFAWESRHARNARCSQDG